MNKSDKDESIESFLYDFAWRGRDVAQQANDRLDLKAMNIIGFASVLIPIITGLFFYVSRVSIVPDHTLNMLICAMIYLILSILVALLTVLARDQGIIKTDTLLNVYLPDVKETTIKLTEDMAEWQIKILNIGSIKYYLFLICSTLFLIAVCFVIVSFFEINSKF